MSDQAVKSFCNDLDRYGVDRQVMHDALEDMTRAAPHSFTAGDRVRSQLSGRTGIVRKTTRAIVLVEYDDIHTNADYAKAPNAWVPHGVLEHVRDEVGRTLAYWSGVVLKVNDEVRVLSGHVDEHRQGTVRAIISKHEVAVAWDYRDPKIAIKHAAALKRVVPLKKIEEDRS